ncbi:GntR family transcriptional regulator [Devosia epidermidihirudinis]|uniref:GntR family transcriptional regulator n=1 Tax=Devosia epidermidihirudinis TaxID=1293439 RepID=UPI000A3DBBF7|nr:GntR family transcriptional regulator [Devosia epidermidihirudinis]
MPTPDTVPETARPTGKAARLREYLTGLIDGGLQPHDRMPTERDLAEQFQTTRLTVRRVLDQLGHEGRLYRTQGAGTFVSEPRIAKSVDLTSFTTDMRARGLKPGSLGTHVECIAAGAEVGAELHISPRDLVVHITRVRTADGVPMCLEHCYMPAALVPGLETLQWDGSLYEVLSQTYGLNVEKAEQSIRATVLGADDATALSVPEFSPAFRVQRVAFDARGRRLEFALSTYRADRYSYDMVIYRNPGNS